MKIRLTIMTENNRIRPSEMTEEKVKKAWQVLFDALLFGNENNDKCIVETVEFVEDGE